MKHTFYFFCSAPVLWIERNIVLAQIWNHHSDKDIWLYSNIRKPIEKTTPIIPGFLILTHQMVSHTEPSRKPSLKTFGKKASTFSKYVAGDWFESVNHNLSLTNQINSRSSLSPAEPVGKSNSSVSHLVEE